MMTMGRGFTLVEMLVALTIFSLLGLMLTESYQFTRHIWGRSEAAATQFVTEDVARKLLEDQFRRALPEPTRDRDGNLAIAFSGSGTALLFIVPSDRASGQGPQIDFLSIDGQGRDRRLVLRGRTFDPINESWPPAEDPRSWPIVFFLPGLDRGDLTYFGENPDGSSSWQSDWRDRPALPSLIRVSLGRHGDRLPDLVVPPVIGGGGGIL